jgi:hypothetical protein
MPRGVYPRPRANVNRYRIFPEFRSWANMIQRCTNSKHTHYSYYGGRGIKVCRRWMKYENFLQDMGEKPTPKHTLDRFPNKNGDYKSGNCRWATRAEQSLNRRNNVILTWNGESLTLSEWAWRIRIDPSTLDSRLRLGWSVESALTTPLEVSRKWPRTKNRHGQR